MTLLFRSMKSTQIGLPVLGPSARTLGVRPGIDVPATSAAEIVAPGQGGLSVSPDHAHYLPYFRRPSEFGGAGKDPVWQIEANQLGDHLCYNPDSEKEGHGFIEPSRDMTLQEYSDALEKTQPIWTKTTPPLMPKGKPNAS